MQRSNNKEEPFYCVDEFTKNEIEKQFEIKIDYKLVSQSRNFINMSLITESVFNILKCNQNIHLISVGCKAFSKNGFKHENRLTFRAKPQILKKFNYNTNNAVCINFEDLMLLLNSEYVEYSATSIPNKIENITVFKFDNIEELFCAWSGKTKIGLLIDKNYKKAIQELLIFNNINKI